MGEPKDPDVALGDILSCSVQLLCLGLVGKILRHLLPELLFVKLEDLSERNV